MNSHNTQGPTTLFRIFVEDTNERESLTDILDEFLGDNGYTAYFGDGHWKGQRERSIIIEVYAPESFRGTVNVLATKLRVAFNQKVVAVAEHNDRVSFYYV